MSRYKQLLQLIDVFQPKSIVETGVWNGQNAIRMINQASKFGDVSYTGYDLFEDGTPELDAKEFNVKHHNNKTAVLATILHNIPPQHSVHLIKGDTNETLIDGLHSDFAFIDGGHSIETIRSDYHKLSACSVIVLDDFYTPDEHGNCPDISLYGCNSLVRNLSHVQLLPIKDPVMGGGYTQFALVTG